MNLFNVISIGRTKCCNDHIVTDSSLDSVRTLRKNGTYYDIKDHIL